MADSAVTRSPVGPDGTPSPASAGTDAPSAVGTCERCGASLWIFTVEYTAIYDAQTRTVNADQIGWDEDINRKAGICCKGCGFFREFPWDAEHPAWQEIDEA